MLPFLAAGMGNVLEKSEPVPAWLAPLLPLPQETGG
jgi:hypothetical protein